MNKKTPFIIGLTGSIGMGKSTTAEFFRELGAQVWDADAAVARLYGKGGAAVALIGQLHPRAVKNGAIDREELRNWISEEKTALGRIEQIVHPLVAKDRADFLKQAQSDIVVLDIPLLFETGAGDNMDMVVVVSAPAEVQRQRVLERPGMDQKQLDLILSRQMPDSEKLARADMVIETTTVESARRAVQDLVHRIRKDRQNA
jgi:dephospho-CoA kinase